MPALIDPDQPLNLIATQRTLVLATVSTAGGAWCAPVYYVYHARRFCFFSSPTSRHIVDGLAADVCAASVFRDSASWQAIEGLQMEGTLQAIPLAGDAAPILAAYLRKFPTVLELLPGAAADIRQFAEHFRARLYGFAPREVYYVNNRAGLRGRQLVTLPE